ncbi:MAG: hypothetical protein H7641_05145 [Candidatus Heimdallarchaeota archaeon]|nr:hypothetical protein [Candidatus Heimdallarchaeota archaeon]MCK4876947.1 hypothetical protein [Candidatus Heimdallarchaeota archaeon]
MRNDVGSVKDASDMEKKLIGDTKMGDGPIISIRPNLNPVIVKRFFATADKHEIPYQKNASNLGTCTDANSIQLSSAVTGLVAILNRYMLTVSEVISLEAVQNIVVLVVEFIRSIRKEDSLSPL